jgi:hypothetical protein
MLSLYLVNVVSMKLNSNDCNLLIHFILFIYKFIILLPIFFQSKFSPSSLYILLICYMVYTYLFQKLILSNIITFCLITYI